MQTRLEIISWLKVGEAVLYLVVMGLLFGCQSVESIPAPETPIEITTTVSTETPIPPCASLADVKLDIVTLSENGVRIRVTGLVPNEPVYTIFSSQVGGMERMVECCPGETASEAGTYEYSQGLRGPQVDVEFTDWQVKVIHSMGAACTEFSLP